jgi:hypothetical protein
VAGRAERPPAPAAAIIVEPSLRVLVYQPDAALVSLLATIGTAERLDRVSIYQLTRDSVGRALSLGLETEPLIDALAARSAQPLPQNVVYALRDWLRPARLARVTRCLVLTFADVAGRQRAMAAPGLRRLAPELLPPARLSLSAPDAAAEERIWVELRRLGLVD